MYSKAKKFYKFLKSQLSKQAEEETTEPPPDPVNIRVSWRLSQVFSSPLVLEEFALHRITLCRIDRLPYLLGLLCPWLLRHHLQREYILKVFQWLTAYQQRDLAFPLFRTLGRPFAPQLQIDINSDAVPCDPEFRCTLQSNWDTMMLTDLSKNLQNRIFGSKILYTKSA